MKIEYGNLWDWWDRGWWVGVTTNCVVDSRGCLVMGAGVALQAKQRVPTLPQMWSVEGVDLERVLFNVKERLVRLPTKRDWRMSSPIELVRKTATSFLHHAASHSNNNYAIPPLGCGLGGLSWEKQVRPMMEKIGVPDNVTVVMRK